MFSVPHERAVEPAIQLALTGSDEWLESISHYSGSAYETLNHSLRHGYDMDSHYQAIHDNMLKACVPTILPTILYRGMTCKAQEIDFERMGSTWISTTTCPSFANYASQGKHLDSYAEHEGCVMRLKIQRGVPLLATQHWLNRSDQYSERGNEEKEITIAPGVRYELVDEDLSGVLVVQVRV